MGDNVQAKSEGEGGGGEGESSEVVRDVREEPQSHYERAPITRGGAGVIGEGVTGEGVAGEGGGEEEDSGPDYATIGCPEEEEVQEEEHGVQVSSEEGGGGRGEG